MDPDPYSGDSLAHAVTVIQECAYPDCGVMRSSLVEIYCQVVFNFFFILQFQTSAVA